MHTKDYVLLPRVILALLKTHTERTSISSLNALAAPSTIQGIMIEKSYTPYSSGFAVKLEFTGSPPSGLLQN